MTNTIDNLSKQAYFKDIEVLDKRLMKVEQAVNNMFKLIELIWRLK